MNIDLIRKETAGCSDKLFLNSAGGSLMPEIVVNAMIDYIKQEEQFGAYEVMSRNLEAVNQFYEETARLLNGKPSNIAFTTSATDAYAKALSSIPFQERDCIITTVDDYISNQIAFISLQKRLNIEVIRMKNLLDHEIDLEDLEVLVKKHHPKLIAVTHIPTNSGLIQNVEGVGAICTKYDILYLVDACQSVGQLKIDVQKIGCDFLTATGRKFLRGPRGTGFLYVSDKALNRNLAPLFLDMRGAGWTEFDDYEIFQTARRFEHWEISYSSLRGLTEAVKYANTIGTDCIENYNKKLAQTLRSGLQSTGYKVLDEGKWLGSIITFCDKNNQIESIQNMLTENKIYYSISNKSSALIDFTHKNVTAAIRLSPHYFNTMEEIDAVISIVS
ncbi:aminotransferase class V-fold PLP-dependent enzyme [Chryseobacterium sp. Alg-005]|uniref:aminotransferase class V-fold PLP-dependent enzyme n=1 Tax=Chryseobacterium sp. Alg-005 TaxID=3159516 RepID=UPI0036F439D0